jgi:hypothetical protein
MVIPGQSHATQEAPAWAVLADVLLNRAALVLRVAFDHRPDPLAGLKVDDEDLTRLLNELPGLAKTDMSLVRAIDAEAAASVSAARDSLRAEISGDGQFGRIVRFAALSEMESEVFAAACAVELDPRRQRVVGYLNDDVSQRRLSLFTLQLLFGDRPEVALAAGPGSGLRRAALLGPMDAGPIASAPITPSATVVWHLSGDTSPDPELPPGWRYIAGVVPAGAQLPRSTKLLLVPGTDRARRREQAGAALGPLLESPLPASPNAWDALVRQATLLQCAVLVDLDAPLPPDARRRVEEAAHIRWALGSSEELPLDSLPSVAWAERPAAPARATRQEWESVASDRPGQAGPEGQCDGGVAGAHEPAQAPSAWQDQSLTAEQLEQVAAAVPGVGGVGAAIRRLAAGHISALAPRIRPTRGWGDLVLDGDRMERLREVVARSRYKHTVFYEWGFEPSPSSGVVAMFSGPSGTGKTLAAEIIAGELSLDLYKVDLAALVSKWVGETEKNLAAVFAAAEASNVALFFDEADAIFGKRSEVSDAHDRYANIEVAYLLQRLERYEGIVVLATNLATNIDPAFLRRVHVSVDFPMPEEPERRRIWERSLPTSAPLEDIDLGLLAKLFKLSGGAIRNAALTAGFIAADAGTAVDMHCVIDAVQREMRKMGRLLTPADFGPYASLVETGTGTKR